MRLFVEIKGAQDDQYPILVLLDGVCRTVQLGPQQVMNPPFELQVLRLERRR